MLDRSCQILFRYDISPEDMVLRICQSFVSTLHKSMSNITSGLDFQDRISKNVTAISDMIKRRNTLFLSTFYHSDIIEGKPEIITFNNFKKTKRKYMDVITAKESKDFSNVPPN